MVGAADIQDAEAILLNVPERIIAGGSPGNNFGNSLLSQAVRSRNGR